jgi:CheY-like chemotaxis protein
MELHGGSVVAESAGPGLGASFIVRLPRLADAPRTSRSEPLDAQSSVADTRLLGIHVLAVDDDPNALGMLASMLELGGAKVSTAQSVGDALDVFRRKADIAVLLSDIGMPDRDGYDLVESLRRDFPGRAQNVTAVAITGYARDEDHARALRAGFDAHLAKPFGMDELLDSIADLVRARQQSTRGGTGPASAN